MFDTSGSMNCGYCGMLHQGQTCPRIKAIEYHQDGITIKRVEFHAPIPMGGQHIVIGPHDPTQTFTPPKGNGGT